MYFGISEYPEHCIRYYGPHPVECLVTIWDSLECLIEGIHHPSKLGTDELLRIDDLNIRYIALSRFSVSFYFPLIYSQCMFRQVINETNTTRELSDDGNVMSQLECFGLSSLTLA